MKKIAIILLLSITIFSCKDKYRAKIEGEITGASKGVLVLKMLDINQQRVIDTIKYSNKGSFSTEINLRGINPDFYYLYYGEKRVASLVLLPGDKIYLKADTLGNIKEFSGSDESSLFTSLESKLTNSKVQFDSLVRAMGQEQSAGNHKKADEINYELGRFYVKSKQEAIKQIYSNPNSITNILLIYHKFTPELPLFADILDKHLFMRVYDSLSVLYATSPYLQKLKAEIDVRENLENLSAKIGEAPVSGFPDISLPNLKAEIVKLSELTGKVILLSFWSAKDPAQKMLNRELLDLYDQYSSKGFEIYQVSVDTDKTAWATSVKEQQLPWISVCDGLGGASVAITTYNVREVPTNYLIDRSGTIVAKNLIGKELEAKVKQACQH